MEADQLIKMLHAEANKCGDDAHADLMRDAAETIGNLSRALDQWLAKTEWVQATSQAHELGMHRADVLRQRIDRLEAEHPDTQAFKNFHSNLCKRFGYTHDERDWRRDLASLEEWIARRVPPGVMQLVSYKSAIANLTVECRYLRHVLTAAEALEARGFFAHSTCADDATAEDMSAMRSAIEDCRGLA